MFFPDLLLFKPAELQGWLVHNLGALDKKKNRSKLEEHEFTCASNVRLEFL